MCPWGASLPAAGHSCCPHKHGKLVAPRRLLGVLQLLTTEKVGNITVAEDASEPR